jgi:hypothetical protein
MEAASTARALPRTHRQCLRRHRRRQRRTRQPPRSHAAPNRASCIGGSGSHCALSPPKLNTSHAVVNARVAKSVIPPKTAKQPSLRTHPPHPERATLMPGNSLHRQLAAFVGNPSAGGSSSSISAVTPSVLAHANDASVWQPRSRANLAPTRKERRKRSAHPSRQVNLVHLRGYEGSAISADEEHLALLALALVDRDRSSVDAGVLV